ncbi:MAG: peptidase C69 [Planctomycetes bacterium]|nr:peptidase C69 [Planctomycetota bacterium]
MAAPALECAENAGASYADVRIVEERERTIGVRLGEVGQIRQSESLGTGVRVLVDGAWGYAAAPDPTSDNVLALCQRALAQARASATARPEPVVLAPNVAARGSWQSPFKEDPFEMSLDQQFATLFEADAVLRRAPEIRSTSGQMSFIRERQCLFTSDGTAVEQDALRSGAGIAATAVGAGEVQTRSYPAAFGGQYLQGGYEVVRSFDLVGNAERVREEAVELLSAPQCPAGVHDLVLGGSQLALQIHESVGHPNEFDRVLGFEADMAGRSFVTPEKRNTFVYGSPIVNLVADCTLPGGLSTFGWDDDGVAAQRWHVVEDGVHRNYLTNREFATRLGDAASFGANRAQGWAYPPQIRIPNLSLMPGSGAPEDLVAGIAHGFFLDTVKTWSIDQMRLNFQFTCEIAHEIKDGELGAIYKNPTYQGITPAFWGSCDGIAGPEHWVPWGVPNCGKGQPMQVAEMSHGCAPARFRAVTFVA